jgi:hypothetical protein
MTDLPHKKRKLLDTIAAAAAAARAPGCQLYDTEYV